MFNPLKLDSDQNASEKESASHLTLMTTGSNEIVQTSYYDQTELLSTDEIAEEAVENNELIEWHHSAGENEGEWIEAELMDSQAAQVYLNEGHEAFSRLTQKANKRGKLQKRPKRAESWH